MAGTKIVVPKRAFVFLSVFIQFHQAFCWKRFQWLPATEVHAFPKMEPHGYSNETGTLLYIARAAKDFGHALGFYDPEFTVLTVGDQNGNEERLPITSTYVFKAPHGSVSWIPAKGGKIPPNLVLGGWSRRQRLSLFICRAILNEFDMLVGYYTFMKPSACLIPIAGKELEVEEFEMLVYNAYSISRGLAP